MCQQQARVSGFTLVEILVAVAIIAILAGILIPSIGASRRQAQVVACQVNLRSIGQLIQAYAQENNGEIPRGPAFAPNPALPDQTQYQRLAPDIATHQLWIKNYVDTFGTARDASYVGLGLLSKQRGKAGNEYLFCPADDSLDIDRQGARIGDPDQDAFGSYLYRQVDMVQPAIAQLGRLDELQFNAGCSVTTGQSYRINVEALAMDANLLDDDLERRHTNHGGNRVNVLYRDSSVSPFDNDAQFIENAYSDGVEKVAWATVPLEGFLLDTVGCHYDRILLAADYGFRAEPWTGPVPGCAVIPPQQPQPGGS